jgi:hypothetical protein
MASSSAPEEGDGLDISMCNGQDVSDEFRRDGVVDEA